MNKKEKFIEKAIKRHGDKYDYSKVEYTNSLTKVCIICPEHGEFWQTPQSHIRGYNCPKCSNRKRGDTFRANGDDFIARAKEVHGDKYSYEKVHYVNAMTKVIITCPKHGDFEMTPANHLNGQGCPKCAGRGLSQDEVVERFREKHGGKYDYSKVIYTKMHEKVCIICPEHGEFWQTPSKHILGQECPQCAAIKRSTEKNIGQEEFIKRCKELYGDEYDYSQTIYSKMEEKVKVICPKHGEFWQRPYDHLHGHGCPKCGIIQSRGENEIYEYVGSFFDNVEHSNRSVLNGYEIDIFIPSMNVGIEYNGLKWHSEKFRSRNYHLEKTQLANKNGVKLIQIFEDEYIHHKDIVLSKIRRILRIDNNIPSVMARKCAIKAINKEIAKEFLDKNHIQGYKGCSIALGCFYHDTIVGVMTFEKLGEEWILNRFATDINLNCQGVGGKLFSAFIKQYNPNTVKSFADLRWTVDIEDNLYTKLGFKLDEILKPDYKYVNSSHPTERIHKFNFRKNILSKRYNTDKSKTENELTQELGYYKIWDCGMAKYVWYNNYKGLY